MWTFTGDEAASRLARGKTARAHELLARVYELDNEHGEPSMKQFSAVWEQQDGGAEGLALSAAVLQCTVPQAVCMDVIDELAPSVADEELRRALYSTVIWSRADFRDWEGAERSSRRWLEASPMVAEAGIVLHRTLLAQGRHDEASQLRGEMAAWEEPPEASTLRSLEQAERIAADDLRGAMEVAAAAPDADTDLYLLNSRAWYAALLGDVDEATLELARKGAESGRSAPLHTLATVLVELERPKEARSALLKSMARGGRQVPDSDDWYVLGRMAELYGCPDAARLAYERVQDDHSPLTRPESTWILAARRLEALAAP
jgi:hypothetical protein